ncbi:Ovarian tumor otubain [Penicillium cosmopolitanum]|uniref:ubiquitinyl hydrolase 1 n=1 Tax=Penicillium cosmopolitanum TaxID=1131564 RepID=A0A9W9WC99_9EURO|nr:Ovarian tumor otubain [Penicillium cosmopolitanum]KAJ5414865.1 Ovarian tumor otubain [Penicillium cosmopolitanum]
MDALSHDNMERFKNLSNDFEPHLHEPLVSTKQLTHRIALDYATEDPTLATKASVLAVTHPINRIMKGDGNCGWRAVAFGYFETLFARRDPTHLQRELARIKSLSLLLDQVGQPEHLYEFFVEATADIFDRTFAAIQNGEQDEAFLVNAFNEEYNSNAVLSYFRLLTSAWMKLNPHSYHSFLSLPLEQYCVTHIETVQTEIDEVGLQALVDVVIEEAGFGVEVLHLDRGEGDVLTPFHLSPSRPSGVTISLLCRSGHYDLLYPADRTINITPVVNYQYAMSFNYSPWDQSVLSLDINSHLMFIPNLTADSVFRVRSPMSPMASVSPAAASSFRASPAQGTYQPPTQKHLPIPSIPISPSMSARPSAAPPPMTALHGRPSGGLKIRLNPLVMKPNLSRSLPWSTSFNKFSSPDNRAHFQNSHFEPIHWEPSNSGR